MYVLQDYETNHKSKVPYRLYLLLDRGDSNPSKPLGDSSDLARGCIGDETYKFSSRYVHFVSSEQSLEHEIVIA